jgi:hypothetical protein
MLRDVSYGAIRKLVQQFAPQAVEMYRSLAEADGACSEYLSVFFAVSDFLKIIIIF